MADVNQLYPRPPDPSQAGGLIGQNPLNLLNAATQAINLQKLQQEMAAKQAIGKAWQNALRPNGTVDQETLTLGLKNPAATWAAPEATGTMLAQQGQQTRNATQLFEQRAAQNAFVAKWLGQLADKPDVSMNDVHDFAVAAARNTGIPSWMINGWVHSLPRDPAELRKALVTLQNASLTPEGAAAPDTTGYGAGGQPITGTRGQAGYERRGVGAMPTPANQPPGIPGLPPGEPELWKSSAERANRLQATATTTAQYHADLENLKRDSKIMDNLSGPTVDVEKKLNTLAQRLGVLGVTMTPEQLRAVESFDKIANQISLNQSTLFHGSDASLHTVVGANPNSSMSRYGREGVIDMLQGNQDAIDRARELWFEARKRGAPANSHDIFMHDLSKVLDPRVFQFNRLNRDNQQKFLDSLDPDELSDFESKYRYAIDKKWVKPLKKPDAGNQ